MIAHVVIHRISTRDYHWLVKDYYDTTVDSGHAVKHKQAKREGRAAKEDYIKRVTRQMAGQVKQKHA